MKYFLILLLAAQVFSLDDPSFGDWQLQTGVFIDGPEKDLREQIFLAHVAEIAAHNADPFNTYQKGLNMYSHLGAEEFIESRCKTVLPEDLVQLATGGKLKADTTTKATTTKATTTKTTKSTTTRKTTTKPTKTTRTTTTKTKPTTKTTTSTTKRSTTTKPTTTKRPTTTKPTTTKPITTTKLITTKPTTTTSSKISTSTKTATTTTAKPSGYPFGNYTTENAPDSVDYSYLMTSPQNQGGCGSCWAFVAMAQLEAMMKIRDPSYNTVLGPQYLVDCDKVNGGCNGGWPRKAMEWIRVNGSNAAPSMTAYPYTAKNEECKTNIKKIPLNINSVNQKYYSGNEALLKALVANYGPIVAAIQVTSNFQSYKGGVFYDATCPSGTETCATVNHAVAITGYGTDPVYGDYWLGKNSWGDGWGEKGYIRMARNKDNNCNIACWGIWAM